MTESEGRSAIVEEALTWLKTPFHHRQATKGSGVDCALFLYSVYQKVGLIPEIEIEEYSAQWHLHRDEERYLNWVLKFAYRVEAPPFKPGDAVMYKFGRVASHGAIIVQWPKIIHAFSKAGMVTLDDGLRNPALTMDKTGKSRRSGIFRLKEWT